MQFVPIKGILSHNKAERHFGEYNASTDWKSHNFIHLYYFQTIQLRSTSSLYTLSLFPDLIDPGVWEVLLTHRYDSSENHKISGLVGA